MKYHGKSIRFADTEEKWLQFDSNVTNVFRLGFG